MTSRALYFLSLFAVAYLIVDSLVEDSSTGTALAGIDRHSPRRAAGAHRPARHSGSGCPRDVAHVARRRADGAVWCLHCDEAFFPRMAEWESALRTVQV